MDHPLPWLRYLEADDLEDDAIDFDEMDVQSTTGEHLGNVDGFIVDSQSGRPYYVVVDAGGWFKSKHFLLPVGHVRFETNDEALVADVDRSRVNKFPGFDKDEFDKLSTDDVRRLNDETCSACSIQGVALVYGADEPISTAWDRPDFRYPDWWRANPRLPERMGERGVTTGAEVPIIGSAGSMSERERIRMRDEDASRRNKDMDPKRRDANEPSPHHGGRAQPGDVIGVETGERTYVGDTAEDENKRRRDAEETARKRRD